MGRRGVIYKGWTLGSRGENDFEPKVNQKEFLKSAGVTLTMIGWTKGEGRKRKGGKGRSQERRLWE